MLKVGLLCGVIAAMSLTGAKANLSSKTIESKSCDTKFIVELNDEIEQIGKDKAIMQQDALYRTIKLGVNVNSRLLEHYSVLNNAFVVSGNKDDLEALKALPGVKSVTEDGTHVVKHTLGNPISIEIKRDGGEQEIDLSKNASAVTMNKPEEGTNDGEGTLIAVLDNEFYLRGKCAEVPNGFKHVTYEPLDNSVVRRMESGDAADIKSDLGLHAQIDTTKKAGEEGSTYFNNKVPFYYDYAGDSANGSSDGVPKDSDSYPVGDFNVYSDIALHGSHVSSIAAGNDPDYKGIAPKAQLVCMKVFSDVLPTTVSKDVANDKYSSFSEAGFLYALEDCINLGVDAINVSIGSDLDDFSQDTIVMRTLSKLTNESNILSAISGGNGGKASYTFAGAYGNWTKDVVETGVLGSFANNADTMSIASGQPAWTYYEHSIKIGDETIAYDDQIVNRDTDEPGTEIVEHKLADISTENNVLIDKDIEYVYVGGFGTPNDYLNKDVEGKVAIVNRGSINFEDKYTVACEDNGAIALGIINNDPTASDFNFRCDFGDAKPDRPCVLLLFKEKEFFESHREGTFKVKEKTSAINKLADTVSDFSSDGASFDLNLKPDITAPGSNIKGAVTPQNAEERKEENKFSSYEYYNGTSMAAPNYEGALAVVVSKVAKDLAADGLTKSEKRQLREFRKTVNMRFMSTANPMTDYEANEENEERSLTSPRMQGAGMADIKGAYNTDVYLEGKDIDGTLLNKSKILLRNNEDIAKGDIKLSFVAHNESSQARKFKAKVTVMRPATDLDNTIVTGEYNYTGNVVSDIKNVPGYSYYSPEEEKIVVAQGTADYKDVIKVDTDITFFENAEQFNASNKGGILKKGYYFYDNKVNADTGCNWAPLPNYEYQSVKDVVLWKTPDGQEQEITVKANGDTEVTINPYSLTKEQKDKIEELYPYGTYIEGFVELEAQGEYEDLSIPYLGFYSLTDRHADNSFDTAPVVEPFEFEKDNKTVYGSDLVNDITRSLLGKDNVEFGSIWLKGYSKGSDYLDLDEVITNDTNFGRFPGFDPVGTKPNSTGSSYTDNPEQDIYVGNPNKSNTMIIQQFVLRSVMDNYFTITNKATGKEVYRSSLEDMLFGQNANGKYTLFKSHVDSDYLGGGYVAHRAYAIVPLYDPMTFVPFESGEYDMTFNYQLAATGNWVNKSYNIHIDSDSPVVNSIIDYKDGNTDMVRITYKEQRMAYAVVGKQIVDVNYDSKRNVYYSDLTKEFVDNACESKRTSFSTKRLFVKAVDYANGTTNAIIHFRDNTYSNFEILQGFELSKNHDFKYENDELKVIYIDPINGRTSNVTLTQNVKLITGEPAKGNGCGGSLVGASAIISVLTLAGAFLALKKKDEELGGND